MWQKRPKKANQKRARWPVKTKADFADDDFAADDIDSDEADDSAGSSGTDLFSHEDPSDECPEPPLITFAVVYERAMRLLVRREHGRKELELKLLQRELPLDLITSVLDNLAEERLQCDVRFAEAYTRMRVSRLYGANKIRADLQARHLEQSITEEAINTNEADWVVIAFEALEKKFARQVGHGFKADFETRAKMQRYLFRRGFEVSEIKSAIKEFEIASSQVENGSQL